MSPTSFADLNPQGDYTYQDYLSWTFPQRVELYRGRPLELSPAPNRRHQVISRRLSTELYNHFPDERCEVFTAPFDVRLPIPNKNGKADTVVQPDLCVVCDKSKLDKQGCNGAPDLVVEILSPGNPKREVREKFELYEEAGVREYWVVAPGENLVHVYVLTEAGKFNGLQPLTVLDELRSLVFPDLVIGLGRVLKEEE